MHNFITMAERDLRKAEIAYDKSIKKKNVSYLELHNLLEKMEYKRVVYEFIMQNYGGK